jgi:hypothetical protein
VSKSSADMSSQAEPSVPVPWGAMKRSALQAARVAGVEGADAAATSKGRSPCMGNWSMTICVAIVSRSLV